MSVELVAEAIGGEVTKESKVRNICDSHPLTCIQALWLKAKLIAWVVSVTGLGKAVSDHLVISARY